MPADSPANFQPKTDEPKKDGSKPEVKFVFTASYSQIASPENESPISSYKENDSQRLVPVNFFPQPAPENPVLIKGQSKERVDEIVPGDIIRFGRYPYGRLSRMGKFKMWMKERVPELQGDPELPLVPIEWIVIEQRRGIALLLSRYAIDTVKYNEYESPASWEDCTLREWLNEEFFHIAFSSEEKIFIQETMLNNKTSSQYRFYNGKDTSDKVFLLSAEDAEKHFNDRMKRIAYPTPYASSRSEKDFGNSACWWWLRNTGSSMNKAACVNVYGNVSLSGNRNVSGQGTVRPAIRADISSLFKL